MSTEKIMPSQAAKILFQGDLIAVKQLFEKEGDSFELPYGSNPLHYGAKNPRSEVLLYLLKEKNLLSKIDEENKNSCFPLELAAYAANLEGIRVLIEYGANYHKENKLGLDIMEILYFLKRKDLIASVKKIIEDKEKPKQSPELNEMRELRGINEVREIANISGINKERKCEQISSSSFWSWFNPLKKAHTSKVTNNDTMPLLTTHYGKNGKIKTD